MKKSIIVVCMAALSIVAFAQNAASDFVIDNSGVITKYQGWDAKVVIPESINGICVTGIGREAFASNDLTSVTIPRSVISIGRGAFQNNKLTSITIPGNSVIIDYRAFYGNPITSITLGNYHVFNADIVPAVNGAESSLFYDYVCNDRKGGTYTTNRGRGNAKKVDDFQYYETQYGAFITGYTGGSGNRLIIPSALTGRPVKALSGFKGITRVQIPDSVTYIGNEAFSAKHNNQLTDVTIPANVTYIGNEAFIYNQLTSVTIPRGVTYIGEKAFYGSQLTSVIIPTNVTYIGKEAFRGNQLTSVVIPDSVTYLSGFNLNQLTNITIPGNVIHIGDSAFSGNQLTSVTIPDSVTHIGNSAFRGNKLTSVTIPDSVTHIGNGAFSGNPLTSVTIGNSVAIDPVAFGVLFESVYNASDKAAGTYISDGRTWTKQ